MQKNAIIALSCVGIGLVFIILASFGGSNDKTDSPVESNNPISKPSESAPSLTEITTKEGISLKLPSDMKALENGAYANNEDVASFGVSDVDEVPITDYKEADVLAIYKSYKDPVIKSFENNKTINGKKGLVAKIAVTTPDGHPVILTLVMVTDGKKNYIVNFIYGADNTDGILAKNLQACIDSVNIKEATAK